MTIKNWIAGISLVFFAVLSAQGSDNIVGSLKTAQGGAFVVRGAERLPAREGMHLQEHDSLQTSEDGRLGIILQDGTRVSLGPNTTLAIDRFLYEPANGQYGLVLRLARGVMAYISGKIAQFSPESVRVETPVGVCGLRGTHFAASIEAI